MEYGNTRRITNQPNLISAKPQDSFRQFSQARLATLISINKETAYENSLYKSTKEKEEATFLKNPLSVESALSYFGLLIGTITPTAIFTRFSIDAKIFQGEDLWILGIFAIVNLITAIVGFVSGKHIGKLVNALEKESWATMMLALPFVGIFWGILTGGAGGMIVLVVGAFLGALIGAAVGGVVLPTFVLFHRLLKRGDLIDRKHFLPLAFGITFVISAFFLGL
jgi:hypothetical protein